MYVIAMTAGKIIWVSPTGLTLMHQAEDGTISYSFPNEPHPQPKVRLAPTKSKVGLKSLANAAMKGA
ncbi:hypothetical protein SEA_JUBIE_129 [Mycobacterium phage Jubie]|nr:hypothetical protein SEA_SAMTY_127 [Mycobacterium phage Samty]QDK03649.1 hypothetical protein SEA_FINNRY_127 [Mycobacterium phage Finnry]QPL15003.1 hypothetical protein SEA_JUBIE_129 [Mycobacterium phage Jubie]